MAQQQQAGEPRREDQPAEAAAPQESPTEAAAEQESPAETPTPVAEVEALRAEVERLTAEAEAQRQRAEENLQGWQRAQADFSNYRRRQEQEQADRAKFAELPLVRDLLQVLDDLDRAWQTLPRELLGLTWVWGLKLIDDKLRGTLAAHGLAPIEAQGKEFDPYLHEAVMREDGETAELTTVVAELQRGYKLRERVIRPSLVKVGKAAPQPAAEAESHA